MNFLSHLATPKTLASALRVHLPECLHLSSQNVSMSSCGCPKRLAFGTVDALIGKLRAIFAEHGRGTEWQLILNIGNPGADRLFGRYTGGAVESQSGSTSSQAYFPE